MAAFLNADEVDAGRTLLYTQSKQRVSKSSKTTSILAVKRPVHASGVGFWPTKMFRNEEKSVQEEE